MIQIWFSSSDYPVCLQEGISGFCSDSGVPHSYSYALIAEIINWRKP